MNKRDRNQNDEMKGDLEKTLSELPIPTLKVSK